MVSHVVSFLNVRIFFSVLEIEPRAFHMLNKCSTTELYPQPNVRRKESNTFYSVNQQNPNMNKGESKRTKSTQINQEKLPAKV
jgi:hypothetical protein